MAILLALDYETTGLDTAKDEPIEAGAVLYSTSQRRTLEAVSFLVKANKPLTKEVTDITGITQQALNKFGYESESALNVIADLMEQADAVVGHNVIRFDKRIHESWAKRHAMQVPEKLWADTMTDLPGIQGEQLITMAAKHGFLPLEAHSALADAQTVLKILSFYDIDKVIERAKCPSVVIRSHQSMADNRVASKLKFRWKPELGKKWLKVVKECDIEAEAAQAPFDLSIEKEIPVEVLWD